MARNKENKIIRTYRISIETNEKLQTIADKQNRSMGNVIECLVAKEYEQILKK